MALVLDTGPLSLPLEMLTMSTNGDETSSAFIANLTENNSAETFWLSSRTLSALVTWWAGNHQRPTSDCNCVAHALGSNTDNKIYESDSIQPHGEDSTIAQG